MFIDQSYFIGPLTIAQLSQQAVVDDLTNYINRFEPIVMEAALGYDFYQAFLAGLNVGSDESIDQRWLDLLNGVVFTDIYGVKKRFSGFANGGSNTQVLVPVQRDDLTIYPGVTPGFPVGGNSYNDPSLIGWNMSVEIFGLGVLDQTTEWTYIPSGGIQLTPAALGDPNYKTSFGNRWIIHFNFKKVGNVSFGTTNPLSPLAGFIYYEYMKGLYNQITGEGFVKSVSENAIVWGSVSPINNFNDAVSQIRNFWDLLLADQQNTSPVYPEFDPLQVIGYQYGFFCSWFYWRNYYGNELYSFRTKNHYGI